MTGLAEVCAELATWLPHAQALTTIPDTDGTSGHGQPSSRPPWNQAAADALLDAVEGARRLEAAWRAGRRRPPGATGAVLASIVRLGHAQDDTGRRQAVTMVTRWTVPILQLAAVDEAERPQHPAVPCPRCTRRMLRYWPRQRALACLGCMQNAEVAEGAVSGEPMLAWSDGLVQVAPVFEPEDSLVT